MRIASITSAFRGRLIWENCKDWLAKQETVLDIGCGTGIVGFELKKKMKVDKFVGCDIENYCTKELKFVKQIFPTKLPFENIKFNVAMFNDVLHHMEYNQQKKLISEAMRVAKNVMIFELQPAIVSKYGDWLLNKMHNPKMKIPFTYRTESNWKNLFKELNLKFETKKVQRPWWYPFEHMAFWLSK